MLPCRRRARVETALARMDGKVETVDTVDTVDKVDKVDTVDKVAALPAPSQRCQIISRRVRSAATVLFPSCFLGAPATMGQWPMRAIKPRKILIKICEHIVKC